MDVAFDIEFVTSWINGGNRCIHSAHRDDCRSCLAHGLWYAGYKHGRTLMREQVIAFVDGKGGPSATVIRDEFPL